MLPSPSGKALTYTNPVYAESFPDPFVLKHRDEYFAFSTGVARDGRVFAVLTSSDLVHWEELSGAMEPLPQVGPFYWAPEVTYYNRKFYLYYSVGNEAFMQIRVATADDPQGPYRDSGQTLTPQDFAIDPHVFIEDDGAWFMFYATDFLHYSHIGTGTVVDRMVDPFTLAGRPSPVTRAKYDWQVYDPARREKGGVRWHTVEGPFVLKRKGRYFEMFSGGNWQNLSYGVGYAVSDSIERQDEWQQQIDGTDSLPLLHTIPGKVIGPGHNCVVQGPSGHELFCIYHRWQDGKRVMCIDRMDFAGGDRLFVAGPSYQERRAPLSQSVQCFEECFERDDLVSRGWSIVGDARIDDKHFVMRAIGSEPTRISKEVTPGSFELAINLRIDDRTAKPSITFGRGIPAFLSEDDGSWRIASNGESFALPDYRSDRFHQICTVAESGQTVFFLDGVEIGSMSGGSSPGPIEIVVRNATVTVDMVRYTVL